MLFVVFICIKIHWYFKGNTQIGNILPKVMNSKLNCVKEVITAPFGTLIGYQAFCRKQITVRDMYQRCPDPGFPCMVHGYWYLHCAYSTGHFIPFCFYHDFVRNFFLVYTLRQNVPQVRDFEWRPSVFVLFCFVEISKGLGMWLGRLMLFSLKRIKGQRCKQNEMIIYIAAGCQLWSSVEVFV